VPAGPAFVPCAEPPIPPRSSHGDASPKTAENGGVEESDLVREQIEYYRALAPEYDATSAPPGDELAPYGRQIEIGLDGFRPTGRVLEIASGSGLWTVQLLRHASSLTALDASREMHELSRKTIGEDPRIRYVRADVLSWEPDGRYDVVFFANWLSHVPPGMFHRFWETVRAAFAPAGRVFFADELVDAWRCDERFRETYAGDPSVPVVRRSLPDGRTFRVVKVFWNPEELRSSLGAMGWDIDIHTMGPFFWAEALPGDRPAE
jgi:methyltransferase family protein